MLLSNLHYLFCECIYYDLVCGYFVWIYLCPKCIILSCFNWCSFCVFIEYFVTILADIFFVLCWIFLSWFWSYLFSMFCWKFYLDLVGAYLFVLSECFIMIWIMFIYSISLNVSSWFGWIFLCVVWRMLYYNILVFVSLNISSCFWQVFFFVFC